MKLQNRWNGLFILAASVSLLLTFPAFVAAQDESEPESEFETELKRTSQLIVMVSVEFSGVPEFGAGIIVGREKDRLLIATAYHVLHRGSEHPPIRVKLKSMKDRLLNATLLKYEARTDLAVLGVEKQGIDVCALPFDRLGELELAKRKDPVSAIGNPNGVAWAMPVEPDRISEITPTEIIFQSNFISKGHSGGALINDKAALLGIVLADQPPFGRAMRIDAVLQLIQLWGYPTTLQAALKPGWTLLDAAAEKGDVAAIKNLLAVCGDAKTTDESGATPLHVAARSGFIEGMLLLLKAGIDVNAPDADGDTPLYWAIRDQEIGSIRFLLKTGARVNVKNKAGDTPLHLAARGQIEIIKMLVAAGARVDALNNRNENPLHDAIDDGTILDWKKPEWWDTLRFLIGAGGKVEAVALMEFVRKGQVEDVRVLVKGVVDLNARADERSRTLLSVAVAEEDMEMVIVLVKAGADPNVKVDNQTPLQMARRKGLTEIERVLLDVANTPSRPTSQALKPDAPRTTSPPLTPKAPSTRFRNYTTSNNQFRLTVPENWLELSAHDSVIFAPDGGVQGKSEITHGILVAVIPAPSQEVQVASEALVSRFLESNSYLRQQGSYQPVNIGGYKGLSTNLAGTSNATGLMENITVYTALLPNGRLFYLISIVPQDERSTYQPAFQTILRSVQITN